VRNEVLLRVKEQGNILHEISKRKANWIGHVLCRNCLLQRVIEGKIKGGIEVTGRRGRRRKKLLDDLKDRRGYSHLKEEALDRTMRRARFGRGFGPVVRQIFNIYIYIHTYTENCIVGIATRYRLEGSGFKRRRGREIFLLHTHPNRLCEPPRLLYNATGGLFPGCREAGAWPCPPTPSSAEV